MAHGPMRPRAHGPGAVHGPRARALAHGFISYVIYLSMWLNIVFFPQHVIKLVQANVGPSPKLRLGLQAPEPCLVPEMCV